MAYATTSELQKILPSSVVIGDTLTGNTNILTTDAEYYLEQADDIINAYLNSIYRIPLIKYKEMDWSASPPTETELYPPPIPLICARLAAAQIYDEIIMANQEPNVSEWGKNIRSLAFDDLTQIQSGIIMLKSQKFIGKRFVRMELKDMPRVPRPGEFQVNKRQPGT